MGVFAGALLCLMLCPAALAWGRPEVYVHAPEGMGTGLFYQEHTLFEIIHREYTRCGPAALPAAATLIECHGAFATCAEWATMHMRTDGVWGYVLDLKAGPVYVNERDRTRTAMAIGLSNFCRQAAK